MKTIRGRVKLVNVNGSMSRGKGRRTAPRPPKVNPRVTAAQALGILRRFPGGDRVIQQLRRAGKKV
jgi:hypothetical protein